MSTLGTRCAICLELRCQLEKMSFFTPELTQKEPERKKKKKISRSERGARREQRDGLQGMLRDRGGAAETVARPKPPLLSAPHTPWRCSSLGCGSFKRARLGVFKTMVRFSRSPHPGFSPRPHGVLRLSPFASLQFLAHLDSISNSSEVFLGAALVKRLAQGLR